MKRANTFLTGLAAIAMILSFPLGLLFVITSFTGVNIANFLKITSVMTFLTGASIWAVLQLVEIIPRSVWQMFSPSRLRCWIIPAHREGEDCREFRVPSSCAADASFFTVKQSHRRKALAIGTAVGIFAGLYLAGEKLHVSPEEIPRPVDYPEMDFPHSVEQYQVGACTLGVTTCDGNGRWDGCANTAPLPQSDAPVLKRVDGREFLNSFSRYGLRWYTSQDQISQR